MLSHFGIFALSLLHPFPLELIQTCVKDMFWKRNFSLNNNYLLLFYTQIHIGGRWARKPVNHTSWVAVVTPTDRPKSVRNCCLIELFCGVVRVVTLPFWHFCWCRGFCHRTGSDLLLFVYIHVNSSEVNCNLILISKFVVSKQKRSSEGCSKLKMSWNMTTLRVNGLQIQDSFWGRCDFPISFSGRDM